MDGGALMQPMQRQSSPGERPQYTRESLTEHLIEAYEWALTLGDADAAVDAVVGIAEINGLLIDGVEIQNEIQATLIELRKVEV
jgi:hypothetical protein